MQIELTEDQIDGVVYDALMTLEENNPTDRKLHKAIKHILSYSIVPTDWEMIYEEDFVDYVLNKKQKTIYELYDEYKVPTSALKESYSSPEEEKIEKTRKGNK